MMSCCLVLHGLNILTKFESFLYVAKANLFINLFINS